MADGALLFDMNTNRHQTSRVEVTRLAFVPFVLNDTRVAFSSCLSGSLHFQAQTERRFHRAADWNAKHTAFI